MTLTLNAIIHFFFSQDTLAYDDVSPDQVWLPRNQQFRKYSRKSHILITRALAVTMTLKIATTMKMSAWHSGSWYCITISNVVTKCSVLQKISSGQTFTDIFNLCYDLDLESSNPIFPNLTRYCRFRAFITACLLAVNTPIVQIPLPLTKLHFILSKVCLMHPLMHLDFHN